MRDLVRFAAETHGNPFFTEELFRHLCDNGRLFDEEGRWRSGFEIGDTEVPQGVRLVHGRRLDRLDPEHRRMLASAAVIGRAFTFASPAAIAGADQDDLFDALEAAERTNLLEELPAEIVGVFFEVITEITELLEPVSGMGHRFQDVVTAAVVD